MGFKWASSDPAPIHVKPTPWLGLLKCKWAQAKTDRRVKPIGKSLSESSVQNLQISGGGLTKGVVLLS